MISRWLLASCAFSGITMAACSADTGNAAGGSGSTAGSTGSGATTGTGTSTTGSGGSSATDGIGGQGGSPFFPVVGGTGGTPSSGASGADGMGGGGGAGGGAAATCNGAALCDSFERTMLGPDWTLDNSTTSTVIEVVTNKAHTGTNSVHISFGTTTLQSYITESKSFPAMGNMFWGRAWIYSMVPLGGHQIYIEARVASGSDHTGVRSANTFDSKNGYVGLNLESSDASKNSTIKMPTGTWSCYEWQITGIGGMGTFTSWVDGMQIGPQSGVIPSLARQRIGIQRYEAGTAGEMWIDDVAIGDQRIGCTP